MYVAANRGQCSFKSSLPDITPRTDDVGVDVDTHPKIPLRLCPAGCSKRPFSKAAAGGSTGGVAPGYVEDAFEARTPLAGFFSVLPSAPFCRRYNRSQPEPVLLLYSSQRVHSGPLAHGFLRPPSRESWRPPLHGPSPALLSTQRLPVQPLITCAIPRPMLDH